MIIRPKRGPDCFWEVLLTYFSKKKYVLGLSAVTTVTTGTANQWTSSYLPQGVPRELIGRVRKGQSRLIISLVNMVGFRMV